MLQRAFRARNQQNAVARLADCSPTSLTLMTLYLPILTVTRDREPSAETHRETAETIGVEASPGQLNGHSNAFGAATTPIGASNEQSMSQHCGWLPLAIGSVQN
ncbi:hypothetical protein HP436_01360 [Pseudomonas sp. CrR14]|nr:hypothetical protein [Pseudomonas sp. CrR14]